MVRKSGSQLPDSPFVLADSALAEQIGTALTDELGASRRAAKTVMRWTGASDRTAKYWIAGTRGPDGWHLILLARNSDAVLHTLLKLADRDLFELAIELNAAKAALSRAAAIIEALRAQDT